MSLPSGSPETFEVTERYEPVRGSAAVLGIAESAVSAVRARLGLNR